MSVYIIAEAGVNHNGDIETAKKMVSAAKQAGCDCVKFQTFRSELLVTKQASKANYQIHNTGNNNSQYEMLKALELEEKDFLSLKEYCLTIGIDFLSTPFDGQSAEFLKNLGMTCWKLPSGEITNEPLLKQIGSYSQRVILSTGMSTLEEVQDAVTWLQESGTKDITLLHCTSNYPTPAKDVNMRAMQTLHQHFGLPVGYSDHTEGIDIPIMAVSLGATIIEKHFTLNKGMPGPDHKASLEPDELKQMVDSIRRVELAFGTGEKAPTQAELSTRIAARKSIVLAKDIPPNHTLTAEDFIMKRPGNGLPPSCLSYLIGKRSKQSMHQDDLISLDDLK